MDVFVARQPILNKNQEVVAYELLYRSGNVNSFSDGVDGDTATSTVITDGLMTIGLSTLACGKKAFVNFTEKLLNDRVALMFTKNSLVVEILENIMPTQDILDSVKELKKNGYIVALDDFVFDPLYQPLIDLADIIKIDFIITKGIERKNVMKKISNKRIKFLAEKVETYEDFKQAVEWGYTYFQGYFFSKPVIVSGKDIRTTQVSISQLFSIINKRDAKFDELAEIIEKDISLTFKLLKYINEAGQYLTTSINSIKHALMIVGMNELKKWVVLVLVRGMGEGKPDIVTRTCMIRARFAEKISLLVNQGEKSSEFFILGMFSMIDVLMERKMEDVLKELPINEDIKRALEGNIGIFLDVFLLVKAYEIGDWNQTKKISGDFGIPMNILPKLYLDAVQWTDKVHTISN